MSERTKLSGDEFYTLDIEEVHKPLPYKYIVSKLISSIGDIKPEHTFSLRLTSVFFTCIGILLLLMFVPKNKQELLLLCVLVFTNPFILSISIFFRYYSFYFFSSVLTLILLVLEFDRFGLKTKAIITFFGSIFSIFFLFILNILQFLSAIIVTVFFEYIKNMKIRIIVCGVGISIVTILILNPIFIWKLLYVFNISGHASVDLNSSQIMGFNLSTLVKPFYAIFQMIFGPDIAPTYSIFVGGLYLFIFVMFLVILYRNFINSKRIFFRSLCFVIIPFFVIYYFFQVLSLPGSTQLEPKHGMLLLPLYIYIIVKSHKFLSPSMHAFFIMGIISAQLFGMVKSFDKRQTDWSKIALKSHEVLSQMDNCSILMDGRSREIFNFYSQDFAKDYSVFYTWQNIDSLKKNLTDKTKIVLLLNDYKSYTNLSLRQNWNTATSSESRFLKLLNLIEYFNYHYFLQDSYVSYPTFYYVLEKKVTPNNYQSFGVWEHHLKDLRLPIHIENSVILSSVLINPNEKIAVQNDSIIIFNLEHKSGLSSFGDTVGVIESDFEKTYMIYGENSWDLFSDFNNVNPDNDMVIFSWKHTPLISGSINYKGSYYSHEPKLLKTDLEKSSNKIIIKNTSNNSNIRVWTRKIVYN